MNFKEYFLAHERQIKGVMNPKDCPVVPTEIPKTGFSTSGARKMGVMAQNKPYKPKPMAHLFRKPA